MFKIQALHHVSLVVADTGKALGFYHDLLGLPLLPRPDLGFPGAWLQLGQQQLHLLQVHNPDPVQDRPQHGGRDRHIAVNIDSLDELVQALKKAGISYSRSRSGRAAVFCRDPDGNGLEFIQAL